MSKRAVFLDRDGVINDHVRYVNTPEDLILFADAGQAIAKLNAADFWVFVVTNQGGIGLGYMKEDALRDIHEKMSAELAKDGAHIDAIRYCPHRPKAGCPCRKPEPKMILDLAQEHGIDLASSFMVGDRDTDVEAGRRAGTKTVFIGDDPAVSADYQANDLMGAVKRILNEPNFH
ncbi:HAD family hydrolase [Fodinisporobacter ferrooxydans]|uniref:D,D-heptose 1,7-bisphosphate phosphatase n=1 Tax=Fodinisporobacter ferrooxydans TaxID=2901836 RepID=A0ABY4CIA8_9BACL|nr:HAD family hydrolase [Alicyclobacillaceae bacterium MYW30-H2]